MAVAINEKPILDDSQCQAIINEAAQKFCKSGTTESFLNMLIRLAYEKGLNHARK
jgi:hypothetical protein